VSEPVSDHRALRERLGAYALGALDRRERGEVDVHLASCSGCREELARLASVPALLGRLAPTQVEASPAPPPDLAERVLVGVAEARRRARRRVRWSFAATGATAVLLLLGVVAVRSGGDPAYPLRVEPVAADAAEVTGRAEAEGRDWGTAIAVDLRDLPRRDGYVLAALARDGRRETAATWAPTASGAALVRGSCAIAPDDMAGYEVTDRDGDVLVRLVA
jgi:anti-sigma factor RsiW